MHPYSTDTDREMLLVYLGAITVVITILANPILNTVVEPFIRSHIPVDLGVSLTGSIFIMTFGITITIIFTGYNGFIWRYLSNWTEIEKIPDLGGIWIRVPSDNSPVEILSLETTDLSEGGPKMVIAQNWTDMEIGYVVDDDEYWRSDTAAVLVNKSPHPELVCTYQSESLNERESGTDRGTLRVRYIENDDYTRLIGRRYTESGSKDEKIEFIRKKSFSIPIEIQYESNGSS